MITEKEFFEALQIIRKYKSQINKVVDFEDIYSKEIKDCNFSARLFKCLKMARINTIQELIVFSINDISRFRNIGKSTIEELTRWLAINNIDLPKKNFHKDIY